MDERTKFLDTCKRQRLKVEQLGKANGSAFKIDLGDDSYIMWVEEIQIHHNNESIPVILDRLRFKDENPGQRYCNIHYNTMYVIKMDDVAKYALKNNKGEIIITTIGKNRACYVPLKFWGDFWGDIKQKIADVNFEELKDNCKFIHLHLHDEYSVLDAFGSCEGRILKAKTLGMPAVAITNHGNLASGLRFYKECKKQGINPILGEEFYITNDRFRKGLTEKEKQIIDTKYKAGERREVSRDYLKKVGATYYKHVLLLAKDNEGLNNLYKLSSLGFTDGFYRFPRIDEESLFKYMKGLICITACGGGLLAKTMYESVNWVDTEDFKPKITKESNRVVRLFKKKFKDDFYIEVQLIRWPEQMKLNDKLIKMAKKWKIKLVLTNDVHYNEPHEAELHDKLIKIQNRDKPSYSAQDLWLKSEAEVKQTYFEFAKKKTQYPWSVYEKAMHNTMEIHKKCYIEIPLGKYDLPKFDLKSAKGYRDGMSKEDYFMMRIQIGWKKKLDWLEKGSKQYKEYVARLKMEYKVILNAEFLDYFLIILDIMDYARNNKFLTWARGSAAGSLICFLADITAPDPIKYDLLFERFLSTTRVAGESMIYDCDFKGFSLAEFNRIKHIEKVEKMYG